MSDINLVSGIGYLCCQILNSESDSGVCVVRYWTRNVIQVFELSDIELGIWFRFLSCQILNSESNSGFCVSDIELGMWFRFLCCQILTQCWASNQDGRSDRSTSAKRQGRRESSRCCSWSTTPSASCKSYMIGRKEMLYLTTYSTHFIYGYMASDIW